MPPLRRFRPARTFASRVCACVVLLSYTATVLGFPISPVAKSHSQPFACMHRLCGCMNALDCTQGCCCAETEQTAPEPAPACCGKPCCAGGEKPCCAHKKPTTPPGAGLTTSACKGLSTVWVSTGVVFPPPVGLSWSPHATDEPGLAEGAVHPFVRGAAPPTPPPRS